MAQPTPYVITTDFSNEEAAGVAGRSTLRNPALDVEFSNLQTTIGQILTNLAIIQRDDTQLQDLSVKLHTLSAEVLALIGSAGFTINNPITWATATAYAARSMIKNGTGTYVAVVAHTSAALFATDLAAGKWVLLFDSASYIASGIAFTPTGGISANNVQNAIAELDTEKLAKASNLSDVTNVANARGNLSVFSKAEVQASSSIVANAGGTVDIITAGFVPSLTAWTDDQLLIVEAAGANATSTPTFNPDGLGAKTIVRPDGSPLFPGDIPGANYRMLLVYDASLDKVLLLNPFYGPATPAAADAGKVWTHNGTAAPSFQSPASAPLLVPVRQSIRTATLDSSGYNALLSAGAGLTFTATASAGTPAVLDFANGATDLSSTISATANNQGALVASNTNYVYADYATSTTVTWGSCLIPPQYGNSFDQTQNALCRWAGNNGAATATEDFGKTLTFNGNASISTGTQILGLNTVALDGTGDFVTMTAIGTLGDGSWELFGSFRTASLAATQMILSFTNAGGFGVSMDLSTGGRLRLYLSSTGGANDIENGTNGASTLTTATTYHYRLQFDALSGTYRLFLSNNGAAETTERSVSSTSRICAITQNRWGADSGGTQGFNGNLGVQGLRRCASSTSAVTPSGVAPAVTDYKVHFFSIPTMTMYEVTAASAIAGTNPTLTARNRLFVGEQDTSGAAVTATRNYAIRGQYESAFTTFTGNAAVSFNHNMGCPVRAQPMWRLRLNAAEVGYNAASEFLIPAQGIGSGFARGVTLAVGRCTAAGRTASTALWPAVNNTAGGDSAFAFANAPASLVLQRGW